jgi:putative heme-binding domain-containing protein
LDLSTLEGQLSALKSPAINVRIAGFEKLKEQGSDVLIVIKDLLNAPNPFHQARAVWLLSQLGTEGISEVKQVLSEAADPSLRVAAYRALSASGKTDLSLALLAAKDPAPAVRREVAISLRNVPFEDCREIFKLLVKDFNYQDRYYLEALGIGLQGKESDAFAYFTEQHGTDALQWSSAMKRLVWRIHPPEAIQALQALASTTAIPQAERLEFLTALAFINEIPAVQAMLDLSTSKDSIGSMAHWWLDFRRSNDWLTLWDWPAPTLDEATLPENVSAWQVTLLNESETIEERENAALLMIEEISGARLLVSLVVEEKLPEAIMETIALPMLSHANREIRSMSRGVFDMPENNGYSIKNIATYIGNTDGGKSLFNLKCSSCHRIGDEGQNIGPNLTRIGGKFDKLGLLDALINPSASIGFGYEQILIKTHDDQVFNGFVLSRNKVSVVLQDIAGQRQTIPLETISSEQALQSSIMPDPASLDINEQSLADLTAYLLTCK